MTTKVKRQALEWWSKAISALLFESDTFLVDVGPESLYSRFVDAAHVAIVETTLGPLAFERSKKSKVLRVNVQSGSFARALRWIQKRREAYVSFDLREKGDDVFLDLRYGNVHRFVQTESTKGVDVPTIPNLSPTASLSILTRNLRLALEEAKAEGDYAFFEFQDAVGGKFFVRTWNEVYEKTDLFSEEFRGGDGIANFSITPGPTNEPRRKVVKSMYPIDYLLPIVRSCPSKWLDLAIGDAYPVTFKWDLDLQEERDGAILRVGNVLAMVAPRFVEA